MGEGGRLSLLSHLSGGIHNALHMSASRQQSVQPERGSAECRKKQ